MTEFETYQPNSLQRKLDRLFMRLLDNETINNLFLIIFNFSRTNINNRIRPTVGAHEDNSVGVHNGQHVMESLLASQKTLKLDNDPELNRLSKVTAAPTIKN